MNSKDSNSSLKDKKFPFWDSSDPSRNPPPMPTPDSPSLNATPRGSPIKSSFHSRSLSTFNGAQDERISELLELSKDLKTQTKSVEDCVNDALVEFGGLAHRSRDNAVALNQLKEHIVKTERSVHDTDCNIKDNLGHVRTTLDTLQENNKMISTISESLLDSNKDVNRQLKNHESHLRSILSSSAEHREFPKVIKRFSDLFEEQNSKVVELLQFLHEDMSSTELKMKVSDSYKLLDSISKQNTDTQRELSTVVEKLGLISNLDTSLKEIHNKLDTTNSANNELDISKSLQDNNEQLLRQIPQPPTVESITAALSQTTLTKDDLNKLNNNDEVLKAIETLKGHIDSAATPQPREADITHDSLQQMHNNTMEQFSSQVLSKIHNKEELQAMLDSMKEDSRTLFIEQSKADSSKLDEFLHSLTDRQSEATKTITDIQSDVRSLVDFQYGDISSFGEQVHTILERLDALKQEKQETEKREMDEQEALKSSLQQEIDSLKETKHALAHEIQAMKTELSVRNEEFAKIEQRVEKFEQRLNQAILERSKGILGSTTMTIINNNNSLPSSGSASSRAAPGSPERSPLKANSGSKRNLSLAPDSDVLEDLPVGKENDITVAKRGSPFASTNNKGRSISLFVDH